MPGLIGSLYIGQGGLNASGVGVSVVSDNIANSNTTGYKSSRAHFEDLLSELIVGTTGANQLGRGVTTTRIEKLFTQGSFQSTGVATDMAISGDGFFVVSGASSGQSQNLYTRNGAFRFDDEGFLITQNGSRVQGYNGDGSGGLSSFLEDLRITQRYLQPVPTSEIECFANLRPDDPISGPFDPLFPEDTSTFRTAAIVFDSLGNAHEVTIFGTRNGQNTWEMNAIVDGSEIDGANPDEPFQIPLGQLNFDNSGRLVEEVVPDPIQVDWIGADPGLISFNFGDAIADGGTGTSGSSQWNRVTESVANFVGQNGYGTGELDGISIDDTGFNITEGLIVGYVSLDAIVSIVAGVQTVCNAPGAPAACADAGILLQGDAEEITRTLVLPFLYGLDARLSPDLRTAAPCSGDECNAMSVCIAFEAHSVNVPSP